MAKFKIQCYNREMTTLVWEEEENFYDIEVAVMEAFGKASANAIIVLMRQSLNNPNSWELVAKFY